MFTERVSGANYLAPNFGTTDCNDADGYPPEAGQNENYQPDQGYLNEYPYPQKLTDL